MLRFAKVTTTNGANCRITFIGEKVESQMNYYRIESYSPKLGDMVAVDEHSKIIIGKVVK